MVMVNSRLVVRNVHPVLDPFCPRGVQISRIRETMSLILHEDTTNGEYVLAIYSENNASLLPAS